MSSNFAGYDADVPIPVHLHRNFSYNCCRVPVRSSSSVLGADFIIFNEYFQRYNTEENMDNLRQKDALMTIPLTSSYIKMC